MRLLVSVRDVPEALLAAEGGADFIDLKEPGAGALGALPIVRIREIVDALRASHPTLPISATIGDVPAGEVETILQRVAEVAGCGVDYVKVGVQGNAAGLALLPMLAGCAAAVVPVLISDYCVDERLVDEALALDAFPALMLDTSAKRRGSLLQLVATAELERFVCAARGRGVLVGLAGALRHEDLAGLRELAPDFAGFRSAVCSGDRAAALDGQRVKALSAALKPPDVPQVGA